MTSPSVDVLFSDLDGTLVHYPKDFSAYADIIDVNSDTSVTTIRYKHTGEECPCVALTSLTGGTSYISLRTKDLIARLRRSGVIFVIITGARASTYAKRRPHLPPADYEFYENGGRMLKQGQLQSQWSDLFLPLVGPIPHTSELVPEMPPPSQREGTLWRLHDSLASDGWKLDSKDYCTNFRVNVEKSEKKTATDFEQVVAQQVVPNGLASSFNLGKADIYPAGSGKDNAARHVLHLEHVDSTDAVALFDDDNDIELGALCGASFLPGVTHASVLEAMKKYPQWTLMPRKGFLGTEDALEKVIALREEALHRRNVAKPSVVA